jgi:hypothetical protein
VPRAEDFEQVDAPGASGRDPPIGPYEVPRRAPLSLGERREDRRRSPVLERQQGDLPAPVEGCDATRRKAAEPSAAIEQQHGSAQLHEPILPIPHA